jgi:hypothetical protein
MLFLNIKQNHIKNLAFNIKNIAFYIKNIEFYIKNIASSLN